MNFNHPLNQKKLINETLYDKSFFDDVTDLFLNLRSGHLGKYAYGNSSPNNQHKKNNTDHWKRVTGEQNKKYYLPNADTFLLSKAREKIRDLVPVRTNIIDFGVGKKASFYQHVLPIIQELGSKTYIGVDVCQKYLNAIEKIGPAIDQTKIKTVNLDFFSPHIDKLCLEPSVGLLMCSTIGNLSDSKLKKGIDYALIHALKTLSSLTSNGWLLVSLDTNQDSISLLKSYTTPLIEEFVLSIFDHIARDLPIHGFDPSSFKYVPEWRPESQLLAHVALATKNQDFTLGTFDLHIKKGQKFHLLNSYKFKQNFFEACCDEANLDVLNVWNHTSPMKLYLLKDRANPHSAYKVKSVKCPALLSAFAAVDTGDTALSKKLT